jgi:hypothetical protein
MPEALQLSDEPSLDGVAVALVEGAFAEVAVDVAPAELAVDDEQDGVADGIPGARQAGGSPASNAARRCLSVGGEACFGSSQLLFG